MSTRHAAVARGEQHYNAKLTADDVRLVRDAAVERARLLKDAHQLSNKVLGEKLGVSHRAIERIVARETWAHL